MMTLFMFYNKERQLEINRMVEDFTQGLKNLGAELRIADFPDL